MNEEKINIVLIDYHQLFREGIKRVIQSEESFQILVSSDDFSVVTQLLDSLSIDVLLIDIKIFMKHVEQIKQSIIDASPSMKVVVMSTEGEENFVTEAIRRSEERRVGKERTQERSPDNQKHNKTRDE